MFCFFIHLWGEDKIYLITVSPLPEMFHCMYCKLVFVIVKGLLLTSNYRIFKLAGHCVKCLPREGKWIRDKLWQEDKGYNKNRSKTFFCFEKKTLSSSTWTMNKLVYGAPVLKKTVLKNFVFPWSSDWVTALPHNSRGGSYVQNFYEYE